jgi:predicted DNA-binding protein with PD1-like motif
VNALDLQIETIKIQKQMDYVDAVVAFSEQNNIEVEDVAKLLHSSTKEKLKYDFIKRNMVRGKHIEPSLENFLE